MSHPYIKDNEMLDSRETKPVKYQIIQGDGTDGQPKSYWQRRIEGDWADMPDLWSPVK